MQKRSQKLQSLPDTKKQCTKNLGKWAADDNERLRNVVEELQELVKHSRVLRFEGLLMRRAYYAGKSGDWESYLEEFRKDDKHSVWACFKVREWYNEAEAEDEGWLSIAQILTKSTEFPSRIISPNGVGGVLPSYVCPR